MVYLLSIVIVVSYMDSKALHLLASILSILGFDFFFIHAKFSFAVTDIEYIFTFLVMIIVSQIISNLTIISRQQADAARLSEQQTSLCIS